MVSIKTFNRIASAGLEVFNEESWIVSDNEASPTALILRSHKLSSDEIPDSVIAIGRAGAGVNNIPVDDCSDKNIVVFNAPGANANAVKELVLGAMFVTSRNIHKGANYAQSLGGHANIANEVEKNKSRFKGSELRGKQLGIIGLGAIGVLVANAAVSLGMKVEGYDPFISVARAWGLSRSVKAAKNLHMMMSKSDFITIHMPLTDQTKGFINKKLLSHSKPGSILLNFSRDGIEVEEDILSALDAKQLSRYVTDFPSKNTLGRDDIIALPHLGASTEEAEENCSIMVAEQLKDYILFGNIKNSVNFPDCSMDKNPESHRLAIINDNVPNMLGQISTILAEQSLNITDMLNKSKNDIAYTLVDIEGTVSDDLVDSIKKISGIRSVRVIS